MPSGRLPAAIRSSGVSMPWLTALRTRWRTGSIIRSIRNLSISVSWPDELELHAFAAVARQVADDERHAAEDLADRHQADAHHAFAQSRSWRSMPALCSCSARHSVERHVRLDALQRVVQAGAGDDQSPTRRISRRAGPGRRGRSWPPPQCDRWTLDDGRRDCGVTKTGRACRRRRKPLAAGSGSYFDSIVAPGRQLPLVVRLHFELERARHRRSTTFGATLSTLPSFEQPACESCRP